MQTITLPTYGRGATTFEIVTDVEQAAALATSLSYVWIKTLTGDARQVKVNGRVRLWKRDHARIEIPFKYGLYEYGTIDAAFIAAGRLLKEIPQ